MRCDGRLPWMCATAFLFGLLLIQHFTLRDATKIVQRRSTAPPPRVLYVIVPGKPADQATPVLPAVRLHKT